MIQRPKINLSGVDDILQEDTKKTAINLDGVDSVLKKKDSVLTQTKSDSETPIGSSAGKNTNGFPNVKIDSPIPNFDDLKQSTNIQKPIKKGKIVDVKSINEKEKLKKEDSSFFDYLKENLDTGIATVSKSIYDAPGMAYDLVANYVTNPIAEALGADKSQLASSDKLAKDLGFKNIPSDILKDKIKISNEKINEYSVKNGGDALAALENGNYSGAAKMIAGTTVQSLPIMAAALLSGGSAGAMTAIGVSTASTKNAELKDDNPEMDMGTRLKNSVTSGVLEATLGHLFTGASGAVAKKILADKGVEVGSRIISNSFRNTIEKTIAKNPLVGAFGEIIEESAVEFGNQLNDINAGIRTEFDVHAIKNAGLSATGMGGVNTVAVYGAKGYVKAKTYNKVKSVNKEVFKLRNEIENGSLSDENKAILSLRADRLETENKKLLGVEVEKANNLPIEAKKELNTLNEEFENLKSKYDDIDDSNDIPDDLKKTMKEEIRIQASKNQKRKSEILSSNEGIESNSDFSNFTGVEPDFNLENDKVSSLPLKEQETLKKQAMESLITELNPDGTKDITITNDQVVERANEILKGSDKNKVNLPLTPSETQENGLKVEGNLPQTENQPESNKPEQEINKLTNLRVIEQNGEFTVFGDDKNGIIQYGESSNAEGSRWFKTKEEAEAKLLEIQNPPVVEQTAPDTKEPLAEVSPAPSVSEGFKTAGEDAKSKQDGKILGRWILDNSKKGDTLTLKDGTGYEITDSKDGMVEIVPFETNENGEREYSYSGTKLVTENQLKQGDLFELVYTDAKGERVTEQYSYNEGTPPSNTPTDGNVRPSTEQLGESGVTEQENTPAESVPSSVDVGESKGSPKVKKIKLTDKGQAFNVERKNGKLAVTNTKGEPVSKPTERAVLRKYADNFDFTNGDKAIERSDFEGNPDAYNGEIAKKSNNPSEIAETIIYAENTDNNGAIKEPTIDHKQAIIAEGIVPITEKGFIDSSDVNDIVPSMKKHYFDDNGRKIDDLAQEMSERAGVEITPKDITDFIKENPKGVKDFYKKGKNKIAESGVLASNEIFDLKAKFEDITGLPATNEFLLKAIEQQNRKDENESVLDNMSDEDFEKAYNDAQQFKKENYGNSEKNTTSESNNESENTPSNERKQRVQGDNTKKPTIKERVAERVKLSDAKIDANSDLIKAKLKAFKDMFPSADINPDDYNTNGFSAEAIVDMVAKAAKSLIEAGITIDEAIKQAIEGYNTHFDDVVDYDAVSEKVKPKKETKNFESKSGKKSLLNRLVEGGNSKDITEALKELSPNYDVRNQEKSDSEAKSFIDKVGIAEALYAAKNNLIPNADIRMLVYDEALTRLKNEIDNDSEQNPLDREALIQEFKDLSNSFDNEVRNMGQGLSILNYIYNKNQSLKYNLTKVIEDYKRNDPNGEIPAEVKDKFEKLEEKLKDLEEKTKEAEARAKIAEEELAIKNVKEDIDRKKQLANKNKSGLTPAEQNRKKVLKNKFFGRLNDATSLVAMLADPEFREYLGLTFKQAKGDFKNFSNKLINELGKGATKHLDTLFNEAKNTKLKSEQTIIIIDEDGNIKIPAKMLRDLVEAGYNDINEISQIIHESILEEYPDVEIRDVRDALTGYGKQINPNKDEITEKINKLKEYGRLLSAYDDVINGEMPKKSGLKRLKPEQKARELRREVNRLAKELNIEPIDLDKQWASALDRIKSSLKKQIEDLDKQIANGEKRKIERTNTPLDSEAIGLKELRDAKKKTLDEMVGKPELTEEQKILRAESFLEKSINKLQEEIDANNIAFRDKPTKLNSDKLVELRAKKKALLEAKKELRQEAGLIDEQRLKIAKTRVKNQIEDLQTRIDNKDFSKKEVTPVLADNELNSLRAEKEAIYEEFEKQKYLQELQNRSFTKKLTDELLESLGLARAIKASLDLGLIGIQLRGFTYSELFRNPIELGRKLIKTFGAIGSQSKTNKAMSLLIGHPLYPLAKKLDIGITHPDLRNEVREELASGNLLHFIWSLPIIATEKLGGKSITQLKRKSVGDYFIDSVKKQYNKLFKNNKPITESNEKFSIAEQWRNVNAFEAVERGLSTYGNQLRFEEFVRGVERLKIEGKDEINHKDEYEALASYIRTFSGRSKPAGLEMNQKALNVFFFSFKNAVSVFQQLNPYYLFYDLNKTNLKNGKFKPTVAGKMAMATMFKSVASSSATLLFLMAGYNSTKDEEDEEATIELDPRSSDFGKFKMGDFRYDPWGGYVPLITLYARLLTEEVKKSDGTVEKLGESRFGIQSRGDAMSRFLINKESPGFQMFHHYVTSVEKIDEVTGDKSRVNSFGKKLSEDEAFSMYPIFMGSIKDAVKNDFEGVQSFLTAYSILGLGNVQYYETKAGESNEQKFEKSQAKNKLKSLIPEAQKIKEKEVSAVKRMESALNELEMMKIAKQRNIPYYVGNGESIDVSDMDFDSDISEIKKEIDSEKKRLKIEDKK